MHAWWRSYFWDDQASKLWKFEIKVSRTHLDTSFGQVDPHGELLSREHVRIMRALESLLQFLQLEKKDFVKKWPFDALFRAKNDFRLIWDEISNCKHLSLFLQFENRIPFQPSIN